MTATNDIIRDRPAYLDDLPFYRRLPRKTLEIDLTAFPDLLRLDILRLEGLQPITATAAALCPNRIVDAVPPNAVVEHYKATGVNFQMVMLVCNTYGWREEGETVFARPYSLSLLPALKRGEVSWREADSAACLIEIIPEMRAWEYVYLAFNPFVGNWSMWMPYAHAVSASAEGKHYSDSIGFVLGTYYLADRIIEGNEVLMPAIESASDLIQRRYRRARMSRYYTPLTTPEPRRIWGAASPIELLLIHGLAARGHFPQIQSLIYPNGEVFPSLYDRLLDKLSAGEEDKGARPITEADLYFPSQKLVVFCDSTQFHRSKAHKDKDARITAQLDKLGFKTVRVTGSDLTKNLGKCVDDVVAALD